MSIQSVDRALSILTLFSSTRTHLGISEIAGFLGLTSSTIHGLVKTLYNNGFLKQDSATKKYSLGIRNFEMGHYFLGGSKAYQVGAAAVHRLAENTGLNVRLAVRDGDHVVVILTVHSKAERFQYYQVGPRVPLYCSAIGKAVLAWLPELDIKAYVEKCDFQSFTRHTITDPEALVKNLETARKNRYALDTEEMLRMSFCVAAPIFDQDNQPVASISLFSGSNPTDHDDFNDLVDELIHTSAEISYAMGSRTLMP